MADQRDGATRIVDERKRQIADEKWTAKHDDREHSGEQLAMAAACYASPDTIYVMDDSYAAQVVFRDPWPWHGSDGRYYPDQGNVVGQHPTIAGRIRELEKAGALVAAEIDRLLRLQRRGRKKR